mmetsp:Transcript_139186/g.246008  ORF Transcript_139186/g.246008 Transcript_139186/m.246008 type:complete len:408 (-) Transcript_139186:99-1322(-)
MSDSTEQRPTAQASRERIAKAGKAWHKVLGVSTSSSIDEVKKAFRQLALLHHPDKPDGDGDTFKTVQEAYVVGMRKCAKNPPKVKTPEAPVPCPPEAPVAPPPKPKPAPKVKAKAKAKGKRSFAETAQKDESVHAEESRPPKRKKPMPWVLPPGASSAKIRKAVEQYEDSTQWEEKTLPDRITAVAPQELAARLRDSSCIPVDVREPDAHSGVEIRGAVPLSYSQVVFSPEEAAPTIMRLQKEGKRIVLFSEEPGLMGTCGMVGSILVDVFGFEAHQVGRLAGGCVAWEAYLDSHNSVAIMVETLMMRLQRKRRSAAKRVAAENAMADAVGLPGSGERGVASDAKIHEQAPGGTTIAPDLPASSDDSVTGQKETDPQAPQPEVAADPQKICEEEPTAQFTELNAGGC